MGRRQGGGTVGTEQEGRTAQGHEQGKGWAPQGRAGQDGGGQAGEADGAGQHGQCYTAQGRGRSRGRGLCVLRCVCVQVRSGFKEFLPSYGRCFGLASVAAMASSSVDFLLADCLAVCQEVSERESEAPQPLRATSKSDTSVASRVHQVICWSRVSQGLLEGAGGDVSSSSTDTLSEAAEGL